jgi:hypothetical protein
MALNFCEKYRDRYGYYRHISTRILRADSLVYRYSAILWIDAHNLESARDCFTNYARELGIHHTVNSVKEYLANHYTSDWLLVLDGADEEVAAYFPSGEGGTIIVTSRNAELVTYAIRINGKLATYELTQYLSPPFWSGMSVTDWDEKSYTTSTEFYSLFSEPSFTVDAYRKITAACCISVICDQIASDIVAHSYTPEEYLQSLLEQRNSGRYGRSVTPIVESSFSRLIRGKCGPMLSVLIASISRSESQFMWVKTSSDPEPEPANYLTYLMIIRKKIEFSARTMAQYSTNGTGSTYDIDSVLKKWTPKDMLDLFIMVFNCDPTIAAQFEYLVGAILPQFVYSKGPRSNQELRRQRRTTLESVYNSFLSKCSRSLIRATPTKP